MPVAGRDLRQERQRRVAEVPRARDQLPRLAGHQPVRLRVVDLAARDRLHEVLEVVRIHLVVAGHHGRDVHLLVDRALVARDDRGADALVARVADHLDARVGDRLRPLDRRVAGRVVDDVDPVDKLRDAGDRRADELLLIVRWDYDCDALALEHGRTLRGDAAGGHPRRDRVPRERRDDAEDQADHRSDDDRVAAAARRHLLRPRRRDDPRLLDQLRLREEL